MSSPAIFFDRDGVITEKVNNEAPQKVPDLKLIPGITAFIKALQKKGYKIIVTSNQPDVALRNISEQTKENLKKRFEDLLKENRLTVDGIYYCFHHEKGVVKKYTKDCNCRKPKPGLLQKAIKDLRLDVDQSYMIGDRASDIAPAAKVGVTSILLDPKNSQANYLTLHNVKPDYTIRHIEDALEIIL